MASSNGRDRLLSRGQRVFAFGSSTPRELSHLNKVPPSKLDEKSETQKPSLRDYIIRARSLSREGSADNRNSFVFGSSTPRSFAHLDKIPTKQRVYDAKIPKKSATHSDFKATPIRYNNLPQKPMSTPKKDPIRHVITPKDDDIASEPDIVQDREEFMEEMRKHKKKLEDSKKKVKIVENQKFAHAPEIEGDLKKTIRVETKKHEEKQIAVENLSANEMNDQVEVSQLNGDEEKSIEQKVAPQKEIKSVEELKNTVVEKVEEKVSDGIKNLELGLDKLEKSGEKTISNILGKVEEAKDKIVETSDKLEKSGENTISNILEKVELAKDKIVETSENVANEISKTADHIDNAISKTVDEITNDK